MEKSNPNEFDVMSMWQTHDAYNHHTKRYNEPKCICAIPSFCLFLLLLLFGVFVATCINQDLSIVT